MLLYLLASAAIDWSPITTPLIAGLIAITGKLLWDLARYVRQLFKTNGERAIFDKTAGIMATEVSRVAQSELPLLERIAGSGNVSKADLISLRDETVRRVKETLGADGVNALNDATGIRSVDDYLVSLLEQKVLALKSAKPTTPPGPSVVAVGSASPPPFPKAAPGFAHLRVLGLVIGMVVAPVLIATAIHGCTPVQERHAAIGALVTTGGAEAAMYSASTAVYTRATDALLARGLRGAAYDTAVAPLDRTYRARTRALNSINDSLRAAAGIVNAAQTGDSLAYRAAAHQALDAIIANLVELESGDVLPPVPIPADAIAVIRALAVLADAALPAILSSSASPAPGGAQ